MTLTTLCLIPLTLLHSHCTAIILLTPLLTTDRLAASGITSRAQSQMAYSHICKAVKHG